MQNYNRTKPFCQMNNYQFYRKTISFAITLTWPKKVFMQCLSKNIDFFKNCQLNSHKNAPKRRKVQNNNRTKPF